MSNDITPAGRPLDAEIARAVFGALTEEDSYNKRSYAQWEAVPGKPGSHYERLTAIPPYSTDIAAAWTIVERLPKHFKDINSATDGFLIEQRLGDDLNYHVRFEFESRSVNASAATLPHAICLAALQAVRAAK